MELVYLYSITLFTVVILGLFLPTLHKYIKGKLTEKEPESVIPDNTYFYEIRKIVKVDQNLYSGNQVYTVYKIFYSKDEKNWISSEVEYKNLELAKEAISNFTTNNTMVYNWIPNAKQLGEYKPTKEE